MPSYCIHQRMWHGFNLDTGLRFSHTHSQQGVIALCSLKTCTKVCARSVMQCITAAKKTASQCCPPPLQARVGVEESGCIHANPCKHTTTAKTTHTAFEKESAARLAWSNSSTRMSWHALRWHVQSMAACMHSSGFDFDLYSTPHTSPAQRPQPVGVTLLDVNPVVSGNCATKHLLLLIHAHAAW